MEILKIGITGTVGAGKTTFVRAISEIEVVSTERVASDEIASIKPTTTVAFDFGRLTLNSGQILHLYGTPGQFRFEFMWDILMPQVHGYVFLVDTSRPQDFRSSRKLLNYMKQKTQNPLIIGLTHTDCDGAWQPEDIALTLGLVNCVTRPPIINVNATNSHSVAQCLILLVEQLLATDINVV